MADEEEIDRRSCATMELHHRLLERDPDYQDRLVSLEHFTSRYMLFDGLARRKGPVRIPVVVHVVWNSADENISDAQIQSQIDVLNRDFRARNPDRGRVPSVWKDLVADAQVEFFLAIGAPDGTATSGITRTRTPRTSFESSDDAVKVAASGGADPWPSTRYLNIWVCRLAGRILGYATFPGANPAKDGVVIRHTAFGTQGTVKAPFSLGRTTTHEIGHWLNLRHIWGDTHDCSGTDYVDDTPPAQGPNYQSPTFPHISCNNGPNGDLFMNYMDYVDDAAMMMFSTGQVVRMSATLDGPRKDLGT